MVVLARKLGLSLAVSPARSLAGELPEMLGSLEVWLQGDSDYITDAGGGAVSEWRSRVFSPRLGTFAKFTQAVGSGRPTYQANGGNYFNGKPAVYFDGGDFLASDLASSAWKWCHDGSSAITVVASYEQDTHNAALNIVGTAFAAASGTGLTMRTVAGGGSVSTIANGSGTYVSAPSATSVGHGARTWAAFRWDPATSGRANIPQLQGANNGNVGAVSTANPDGTMTVGGLSGRLAGRIRHLFIYSSFLSDAQIAALGDYLEADSGLTFRTPADLGFTRWWDPSTGTTIGTGVSAWAPRLGSGTWVQATGTKQPTLTATDADFNGRPSIGVDNTDDNMTFTGELWSATKPWSVSFTCKTSIAQAPGFPVWYIFGQYYAASFQFMRFMGNGDGSLAYEEAGTTTLAPNPGTSVYHYVVQNSGAGSNNLTVWRNGVPMGTFTRAAAASGAGSTAWLFAASAPASSPVKIAELAIRDGSTLSSEQIERLYQYNKRFGV